MLLFIKEITINLFQNEQQLSLFTAQFVALTSIWNQQFHQLAIAAIFNKKNNRNVIALYEITFYGKSDGENDLDFSSLSLRNLTAQLRTRSLWVGGKRA